ncbi:hypothetical protein B0J11DRAFT_246681 [Dendryphion nanum]|uniref:Uncharacterized protein n=1 Tax=Dendryphion nanum TaxID=256645 RepID=A0A9P9E3S8_9PLEO|nr:hypothetical protein B0J11DRAFT_246681 [Dendryphion nanum]
MPHQTTKVPTARLSEENLRKHNASCPKQTNEISGEGLSWKEEEAMMQNSDWSLGPTMADEQERFLSGKAKKVMALRRAASRDALGLYTAGGVLASWDTQSNRMSSNGWRRCESHGKARGAIMESGSRNGDLETVDLRELVYDMARVTQLSDEESDRWEGSVGSLQASSDTLSVSRFQEIRKAKKKGNRRMGLRKHRMERARIPTSAPRVTVD